MKLLMRVLAGLIGIYAIGALIIGGVFFFILPNTAVNAFIRTGLILALIPSLIFLVIAFFMRGYRLVLVLLLLPTAIFISYYLSPYMIPSFADAAPDATPLRVITYNVRNLRDPEAVAAFEAHILNNQADIVCFQELSQYTADTLQQRLGQYYPFQAIAAGGTLTSSGQGIFSRYPINAQETWDYRADLGFTQNHQRIELDINGQMVVLYNIHPNPPIEWDRGVSFAANEQDILGHQVAMQRMIDRMQTEMQALIVVGDMNMSEQFPEYGRLSAFLVDSFKDAGFGLGMTYPADTPLMPLIRLDYIFHSQHFVTTDAQVLAETHTSDHLPVLAELMLAVP